MPKVFVYETCEPLKKISNKKTQLIQTTKLTSVNVVNTNFKDSKGICWIYVGEFDSSYISPIEYFSMNYNGNYFAGDSVNILPECDSCLSTQTKICSEVFFSATKCEDNTNLVVKGCNYQLQSTTIRLKPEVNQVVGISNPDGDDFCVKLVSEISATDTQYTINTPSWKEYDCENCPKFHSYIVNSCNGYFTGLTVYDKINSNVLPIGTSILLNSICFNVVSYRGVISDSFITIDNSPFVETAFNNCDECNIKKI